VGDQECSRSDDHCTYCSTGPLKSLYEAFSSNCCAYQSHYAEIHDADDEENRRQIGAAVAAVEAQVQTVAPRSAASVGSDPLRPGVSRQWVRWCSFQVVN
jgi:hypothetical protein